MSMAAERMAFPCSRRYPSRLRTSTEMPRRAKCAAMSAPGVSPTPRQLGFASTVARTICCASLGTARLRRSHERPLVPSQAFLHAERRLWPPRVRVRQNRPAGAHQDAFKNVAAQAAGLAKLRKRHDGQISMARVGHGCIHRNVGPGLDEAHFKRRRRRREGGGRLG